MRAREPSREQSSDTSRVLPTPGSPTTLASKQRDSETACSKSVCSCSSFRSRPTSGRPARAAGGGAARSRKARTGSDLPLAAIGASGSTSARERAALSSPSRISPGCAACSRRAATLTASPVTKVSREEASPLTTSPVLIPMRSWSFAPKRRSSSSFKSSRRLRISSAARVARRASSSCASGTPKTARTASPTNFSTVPPWPSIAERIWWK